MDWSLKLKCCAFAIASVTLGLSAVYVQQRATSSRKRRKSIYISSIAMAAAAEIDCPNNSVSQLVSTMEQLKVAQQPAESPQLGNEEAEIPDRDSANHSPSDFLSGNLHSDSHSESSNDSGKGGSDCANTNGDHHASNRFDVITPPLSPHHPTAALVPLPERLFVYEFEIPQALVGLLIGKYGAFVNQIKDKTGASLLIKDRDRRCKLCAVEGTKTEIDTALELIRGKFPIKRYPHITMAQINVAPETTAIQPVLPDSIQLLLPPEVSCDVMISAVVSPNHIFLQQITHPTYPSLARLDICMAQCYNEFVTPGLPLPIRPSMVCAAPSMDGWYRAKVVAVYPTASLASADENAEKREVTGEVNSTENTVAAADPELELRIPETDEDYEVDICFVDYGGYSRVPASCLRQIRADFMSLPFQAIECLLANVAPASEEEGWTTEAYDELESLTRDRMLQGQAMAYSLEGLPLVYLYQMESTEEALINRQLVNRGVAQWVEPQLVSN
ncbi:A-kinase anchor protein 1, mitochondrial-like isoform X2 [Daphnia pulex]|uniref:A-kinase anchor protein 1, mitochondrial-like isoform X2 n=1 Tax=Daphnia pulex TaxID=6669 RepID=UPI001EE0BF12|nr:A-kinase anchor protein 1, mitochondrial-like isoform X2 [Daphnia pulex]